MAESSVVGGAAVVRFTLATFTAGVCADSTAGSRNVATMNSLGIRVIGYFFCVGGVPARVPAALLFAADAPDWAFVVGEVVAPFTGAVRPAAAALEPCVPLVVVAGRP